MVLLVIIQRKMIILTQTAKGKANTFKITGPVSKSQFKQIFGECHGNFDVLPAIRKSFFIVITSG